jgi:hypothetical protein
MTNANVLQTILDKTSPGGLENKKAQYLVTFPKKEA